MAEVVNNGEACSDYKSSAAELKVIILAAGKGTRMKSEIPKVLHKVCGLPMIQYVIWEAKRVSSERPLVVVGYKAEMVTDSLGEQVEYVIQKEQLGTGHAIMEAQTVLQGFSGDLLVLYGDTPFIHSSTLEKMITKHREEKAAVTVLTAEVEDPTGYGRILRSGKGEIARIVEEKDASREEKEIREVNTGLYCFRFPLLAEVLSELIPKNSQGEYYLTDVVALLTAKGRKAIAVRCDHPREILGPNDRKALAETERLMRESILDRWMAEGVSIIDPNVTYIGPLVKIGMDTKIYPGSFLEGETEIGENCIIGPYSQITDSKIGNSSTLRFTVADQCQISDHVNVGPYTNLRPGVILESGVKVGGFVEVKNTRIGKGSKAPHLSYIGDSQIGAEVNIGAGTITCNFDGKKKHRTLIEDGAFVGSNTNLVAPVSIGKNSFIGAGSTITKDVPDQALAIARAPQVIKENWAKKE